MILYGWKYSETLLLFTQKKSELESRTNQIYGDDVNTL